MRAALVVLVLLLSGCAAKPSGPAPTTTAAEDALPPLDKYSYRGAQCFELGLDVPVDAAKVRPHVPSKYRLTGEAQGRAVMALAFARCDRMVPLDAKNATQIVQVDVAVMIEGGAYEIAYTTNSKPIAENATRVAFPAHYAPTSTMLGFPLQGTDTVQVHVRGGDVAIDVEGTAARGRATATAGGTYFHSGPNGTSRMIYDVSLASIGPAAGKITVPTGSMLAQIFGATRVDGVGFYGSFNLGANLTRLPG